MRPIRKTLIGVLMVAVSTPFARQFLRTLAEEAASASTSLLAALQAAGKARVNAASGGKFVITTSANGHLTSFAIDSNGASPTDIVEMVSELRDRYDEAVALLGAVTDDEILEEMLSKLRPIRSVGNDFSGLRLDPTCETLEQETIVHSDATLTGDASPEGVEYARVKTFYWDNTNKILYIKTTDISLNTGWQELIA